MAKKNSNKILIVVLLGLIIGFLILKIAGNSGKETNFKTKFGNLDTTDFAQILLYPASEKGAEIKFYKQDNVWVGEKDGSVYKLKENTVENFIKEIKILKPVRLAAKSNEKWADYQVNDSLGTRLMVKNSKGDVNLDIMIGKFSVKQSQNQYQGGNMNFEGITYVREYDEDEVYSIDGFVAFTFNQKLSAFRENTFIKAEKDNINKLQFEYIDSSFIAMKQDTTWLINGKIADNSKMKTYLQSLSNKTMQTFEDDYTPIGNPVFTLKISGDNFSEIKIQAYVKDSENYVLTSSLNNGAYFSATKSVVNEIFKGPKYF